MTQPRGRDVLIKGVATFVGAAAFPRLAYRLRWPSRLGRRGLVAYVASCTMFIFMLHHFALPYMSRIAEEREQLRDRLGREPTEDELLAHLGYDVRRRCGSRC